MAAQRARRQIVAIRNGARVEDQILTIGPHGDGLGETLRFIRVAGELLGSWSNDTVSRRALAAWAAATAGPLYGRQVPAELMTQYDRRRPGEGEDHANGPATDNVRELAWLLACKTRRMTDVERRTHAEAQILTTVNELPWWSGPGGSEMEAPGPNPTLVH